MVSCGNRGPRLGTSPASLVGHKFIINKHINATTWKDLDKSKHKLANILRENIHKLRCWYGFCVVNRTNINLLLIFKTFLNTNLICFKVRTC